VDLIRPRVLYTVLLAFWSLAAFLKGVAQNVLGLIGCRMGIGLFQAPSYPCHNRMVTSWFPVNERASAIAFYTSGQFLGLALATPILMAMRGTSVGGACSWWSVVSGLSGRPPITPQRCIFLT
jgi:ACS family D-galactonate transporter-like MFS transporter